MAISADGERWFLINASPDLRAQLEESVALQPKGESFRGSPIEGVLLTNADLDHVLGLISLREGRRISTYATEAVRKTLNTSLRLEAFLGAFAGIEWRLVPAASVPLLLADGTPSGLKLRAIPLPGGPPRFAEEWSGSSEGHSVAYEIVDEKTDGKLLVAPDVSAVTPDLERAMQDSTAVLFDGTFWSDDELQEVHPGARTSREMGHLPIAEGSLEPLRKSAATHKIYLHINNTNPILSPGSPERARVEAAGIAVGEDGMEFEL